MCIENRFTKLFVFFHTAVVDYAVVAPFFSLTQLTIARPAFVACVAMAPMILKLHLPMSDSIELNDSVASRIRFPIFIDNKMVLLLMVMSAWLKFVKSHKQIHLNSKCIEAIWHLLPEDRLPWPQHRPVMGIQRLMYCIRPSLQRHFQCCRKPIGYCCGPIHRLLLPRSLYRSDNVPPDLWPCWLHRRM